MVSRKATSLTVLALAAATIAAAQTPTPVRLSFADAVRRAAGTAPVVALAGLRTDEAQARVRQARAALLPSVTASAAWVNRTFNKNSLGINLSFPGAGLPTLIGPFNTYDSRLQVTQTLLDFSSVGRVRAARAQATGAIAEGGAASEAAAGTAALAYLRAARAAAVVGARQADSAIAAELVGLAQAQRAAGVSAAIDVTRARTQLVVAEGALVVARNQRDRARIDLARALGLDPATPLELTDTLTAGLGAAETPANPDSAIALAVARRPDLAAEAARGDAARRAAGAIAAERLPRIGLEADYGGNGPTVPSSIGTGQIAVQVTLPILDGFRREGRAASRKRCTNRQLFINRRIHGDDDRTRRDETRIHPPRAAGHSAGQRGRRRRAGRPAAHRVPGAGRGAGAAHRGRRAQADLEPHPRDHRQRAGGRAHAADLAESRRVRGGGAHRGQPARPGRRHHRGARRPRLPGAAGPDRRRLRRTAGDGELALARRAGGGAGAPGGGDGAQGALGPGAAAAPRPAANREPTAARRGADGGCGGGRAARGGAGSARRRGRPRGGGPGGARPRGAAALLHARHRADGGRGEQEERRGGPAGAAGSAADEPGVAGRRVDRGQHEGDAGLRRRGRRPGGHHCGRVPGTALPWARREPVARDGGEVLAAAAR